MDPDEVGGAGAALRWTDPGCPGTQPAGPPAVEAAIEALYTEHAVGLIKMAYVMLGDRPAAEDVVQDAFCNLYRGWDRLAEPDRALPYVRSSVLNGCRSALRRQAVGRRVTPALYTPPAASAETAALGQEERQAVMRAVRKLPERQREALVLRFYLDLPEHEIARTMGVRPSSVRSATHRALKALGLLMEESS